MFAQVNNTMSGINTSPDAISSLTSIGAPMVVVNVENYCSHPTDFSSIIQRRLLLFN